VVGAAARTHVGRVREGNEDAHVVTDDAWVVADGMGGHPGGEVASELAARAAADVLTGADDPSGVAEAAFTAAQQALRERAGAEPALARMGTTLVTAVRGPDGRLHVASAGDSRAYWLDGSGLRQVTRDDNEAEQLVVAGVLDREQARHHPGQFVLTNCLIANDPAPQVHQEHVVEGGGRLLLCTDGLSSEVDDGEIARLLGDGDVDHAADALVQAALDGGGSDNVTVVVVDLP
jgi:serine/threonine protein phosphatase PrpC